MMLHRLHWCSTEFGFGHGHVSKVGINCDTRKDLVHIAFHMNTQLIAKNTASRMFFSFLLFTLSVPYPDPCWCGTTAISRSSFPFHLASLFPATLLNVLPCALELGPWRWFFVYFARARAVIPFYPTATTSNLLLPLQSKRQLLLQIPTPHCEQQQS
jgi:hypothetical protein